MSDPLQLTCLVENVCLRAGQWSYFSDDGMHADDRGGVRVDTPFVHIGSFGTSQKLHFRVLRTAERASKFGAAQQISEVTLLTRASNPMFWHWIADELFSIYWTLEHWRAAGALPGVSAPLDAIEGGTSLRDVVRVLLLGRASERAAELHGAVSRWPVLLAAGDDGRAPIAPLSAATHFDTATPTSVCFAYLIVGAASRQLGGPGVRLIDARVVAAFARFVWHAYGAGAASTRIESSQRTPLVLVDTRSRDRRILNADEVERAMRARLQARVLFVDLASLPRAEQLAMLARTSLLIAVHGSALANVFWLPRNAHVLELFPFGFARPTYEGVCREFLSGRSGADAPLVHYHRWRNVDRARTVFYPERLVHAALSAAERDAIVNAPAFDHSMNWAANMYWVNQDTYLPLDESDAFWIELRRIVDALRTAPVLHTEL